MPFIKKKYITISILISGVLNAVIGGFLINSSFKGHSSIGILIGALIPLAALAFYGDGYSKYKGVKVTHSILTKIFRPSIKIGVTLLIIMLILALWIAFTEEKFSVNREFLSFAFIFLSIFLIPNLVLQLTYYFYLKRLI